MELTYQEMGLVQAALSQRTRALDGLLDRHPEGAAAEHFRKERTAIEELIDKMREVRE